MANFIYHGIQLELKGVRGMAFSKSPKTYCSFTDKMLIPNSRGLTYHNFMMS